MGRTPVRGLLLDFYGTVVRDDSHAILAVCERIHAVSPGTFRTAEDLASLWLAEFASELDAAVGPAFRPQRTVQRTSLERVLRDRNVPADVARLTEPVFAYWQAPQPYPDALTFLRTVRLPVCVVSNVDRADLLAAMSAVGVSTAHVVTSEDVRSYKPRPDCFRVALSALGLAASDVLHVGDSAVNDVVGAAAVGVPAVWVNRAGRPRPAGLTAVREVSALTELHALLPG